MIGVKMFLFKLMQFIKHVLKDYISHPLASSGVTV